MKKEEKNNSYKVIVDAEDIASPVLAEIKREQKENWKFLQEQWGRC